MTTRRARPASKVSGAVSLFYENDDERWPGWRFHRHFLGHGLTVPEEDRWSEAT